MDYGGNNTYILGGTFMMLVDEIGDSIWKKPNPFLPYAFLAYDTHRTSDDGYAFCGTVVKQTFPSYQAIAFVKLDSLGNTIFTSIFDPSNSMQPVSFFPNPASNEINICPGKIANEKKLLFTLTDLQGRNILKQSYDTSKPIDVSAVPEGLYMATLKGKEKEVRGKVIIQR
jgi:hypothetical protein